jgi:uncharacterized small protein (DUF1192 family)
MSEDIASRDYEAEIYLLKAEIKRLEEFEAFYVRVHKLEYVAGIVKPYEEKIKALEADVERLKCCGNCKRFTNYKPMCKMQYIHKDLIRPWVVCENWIWDEADKKERTR